MHQQQLPLPRWLLLQPHQLAARSASMTPTSTPTPCSCRAILRCCLRRQGRTCQQLRSFLLPQQWLQPRLCSHQQRCLPPPPPHHHQRRSRHLPASTIHSRSALSCWRVAACLCRRLLHHCRLLCCTRRRGRRWGWHPAPLHHAFCMHRWRRRRLPRRPLPCRRSWTSSHPSRAFVRSSEHGGPRQLHLVARQQRPWRPVAPAQSMPLLVVRPRGAATSMVAARTTTTRT